MLWDRRHLYSKRDSFGLPADYVMYYAVPGRIDDPDVLRGCCNKRLFLDCADEPYNTMDKDDLLDLSVEIWMGEIQALHVANNRPVAELYPEINDLTGKNNSLADISD